MSDQHEHVWRLVLHLDGCHAYQSAYSCECGATRSTTDERDPKEDPYSMVWMLPEDCERCQQLWDGMEPTHSDEIVLPA